MNIVRKLRDGAKKTTDGTMSTSNQAMHLKVARKVPAVPRSTKKQTDYL